MTIHEKHLQAVQHAICVAPGHQVALAEVHPEIAQFTPQTQLGKLAHAMVSTLATVRLSLASTSAYVFGINESTRLPQIAFKAPPPGTTLSVQSLQGAYNGFSENFKTLQTRTKDWISAEGSEDPLSIYSKLTNVPTTVAQVGANVSSQLSLMSLTKPGSCAYEDAKKAATKDINNDIEPVTSLISLLTDFANDVEKYSALLLDAANGGVLSELQAAYQSEISALNRSIAQSQANIARNNSEISSLKKEIIAAGTVTAVGAVNWWNPIGWVAAAGGGIALDRLISQRDSLEAENASSQLSIGKNNILKTQDGAAAALVATFADQVAKLAVMNTSVQEEIAKLETLFGTLQSDMKQALESTENDQVSAAQNEWNAAIKLAQSLELVTLYSWPGIQQLMSPCVFQAYGDSLALILGNGGTYTISVSSPSWKTFNSKALSLTGGARGLFGISGRPAKSPATNPTPASSFAAMSANGNQWSDISNLAMAQLATGGQLLAGIVQSDSRPTVAIFDNTGWHTLPNFPEEDIPKQLAITASGTLYAISNNLGLLYGYTGSAWVKISATGFFSISANGNYLALIDGNNHAWRYENDKLSEISDNVQKAAVSSHGNLYLLDLDGNLSMVPTSGDTQSLATGVTEISISDTDIVFWLYQGGNTVHYQADAVASDSSTGVTSTDLPMPQ